MATNGEGTNPECNGNNAMALIMELWEATVNLHGSVEPADYKRHVLPIIFLRFLSLRYERRRVEPEAMMADPERGYWGCMEGWREIRRTAG